MFVTWVSKMTQGLQTNNKLINLNWDIKFVVTKTRNELQWSTMTYNDQPKWLTVKEKDKKNQGEAFNEQKTSILQCHATQQHKQHNTTQHNSELYRKSSTYEHQNRRCKLHSYFHFLVFKSVSLPDIFTRSPCHWLGARSHFSNIEREPNPSLV